MWGNACRLSSERTQPESRNVHPVPDCQLGFGILELKFQFCELLDFLEDPTFVINQKGVVVGWNRAMENLTHVKAKDMLGKGRYEHALPFYGARVPILADLALTKSGGRSIRDSHFEKIGDTLLAEVKICRLPENVAHLWLKAKPLYDLQGATIGAMESIRTEMPPSFQLQFAFPSHASAPASG